MSFEVPIALILFKRAEKSVKIAQHIKQIAPKKIYLLADGARNAEEAKLVDECRKQVEAAIDWDCEVIKHYAKENIGVYDNIGEGAKWVLSQEKWAIFLEDDNFPEITFFEFCREMLEKYEHDDRILWICGTNYLGKYESPYGHSYVFTEHMLPCGWASWSDKFIKMYDGYLEMMSDKFVRENVKYEYITKRIAEQSFSSYNAEYTRLQNKMKPKSWDHQMDLSIMMNHCLGIVPTVNQITNIGVDNYSIHGGSTMKNPMTKRYCEVPSYPVVFPLVHPPVPLPDHKFEMETAKLRTVPFSYRMGIKAGKVFRKIFRIPESVSLSKYVFNIIGRRK